MSELTPRKGMPSPRLYAPAVKREAEEDCVKDWIEVTSIVGFYLLCLVLVLLAAWMVWEIVEYNMPA